MTEEKIIDGLKQIKEMFDNMTIHGNLFINRPDIYSGVVNSMLDLYNKQKGYIEDCEEKIVKFQEHIDKQQKEIEDLKFKYQARKDRIKQEIDNCSISKDKIRDKIKELLEEGDTNAK